MNQGGSDISTDMSDGCPVPVGNSVCGETNSLEIMKEFNRLYEERMNQVDSEGGGDCLQEKIKLQHEWIRNLTQQNEMLVVAVQELEYEATERVHQLEEKLQKSAQCLCEVMKKYREHDFAADLLAEPLQKISHLEDDIRNVLEFIRRIRENNEWSVNGLFFNNISKKELLGTTNKFCNKLSKDDSCEGEKLLNEKDRTVQELTQKLNYYNSFGDVNCMAQELQMRREECESLKQEMANMRQALTEEVAAKHDQNILLRRDIQICEDRCLQADKQTAFKEDIIRELRKEIKLLKQQVCIPEKPMNLSRKNPNHMQTQVSKSKVSPSPKQQSRSELEKPYIIVNHTSRKEDGKNTIIYINKDGTVQRQVNHKELSSSKNALDSKDHTEICLKCKNKLKSNKSFFPICKSENDLINIKNALRPVKPRSKLTNTTLGRCKTFVDQTKRILNEIEFEEIYRRGKMHESNNYIPVKMHVNYLEKKNSL